MLNGARLSAKLRHSGGSGFEGLFSMKIIGEPTDAESRAESPSASAPTALIPGRPQIRPILLAALGSYAVAVILSAALAVLLVFTAGSGLNAVLGGSSIGSSISGQSVPQPSASDLSSALQLLLIFTAYAFFASHFGPLQASALGGATYSVIGIGSLTIVLVAFVMSFGFARRMERRSPSATAKSALARGALIGVPYGAGALALYIPSVVSLGPQQLSVTVQASFLGVFLAAAIAAAGGSLARAGRPCYRRDCYCPDSGGLDRCVGLDPNLFKYSSGQLANHASGTAIRLVIGRARSVLRR
jgi:hypothetical protein